MKNWNAENVFWIMWMMTPEGILCVNGELCNTKENEKNTRRGKIERKKKLAEPGNQWRKTKRERKITMVMGYSYATVPPGNSTLFLW